MMSVCPCVYVCVVITSLNNSAHSSNRNIKKNIFDFSTFFKVITLSLHSSGYYGIGHFSLLYKTKTINHFLIRCSVLLLITISIEDATIIFCSKLLITISNYPIACCNHRNYFHHVQQTKYSILEFILRIHILVYRAIPPFPKLNKT